MFSAKPDDPSLILGPKWWKERINSSKLFSETCPSPTVIPLTLWVLCHILWFNQLRIENTLTLITIYSYMWRGHGVHATVPTWMEVREQPCGEVLFLFYPGSGDEAQVSRLQKQGSLSAEQSELSAECFCKTVTPLLLCLVRPTKMAPVLNIYRPVFLFVYP